MYLLYEGLLPSFGAFAVTQQYFVPAINLLLILENEIQKNQFSVGKLIAGGNVLEGQFYLWALPPCTPAGKYLAVVKG